MAGGVGLVGVALGLVPASGEDGGPEECGGQSGEGTAVGTGGRVGDVAGCTPQGVGSAIFRPDLRSLRMGECRTGRAQLGAKAGGCFLSGGFDQFAQGTDVRLCPRVSVGARSGDLCAEGVEGFGGLMPGSGGSIAAGGGVFLRCAGFQAGLELGQGEVGGDLPAGVVDLLAVLVQVAGPADGVTEEVSRRATARLDQDVLGFEVGEEFLGAGGVRDGGADAVLEPLAAGLLPAETIGLVYLGLSGAPDGRAVALLQAAQPVVLLDLTALVADAGTVSWSLGRRPSSRTVVARMWMWSSA